MFEFKPEYRKKRGFLEIFTHRKQLDELYKVNRLKKGELVNQTLFYRNMGV